MQFIMYNSQRMARSQYFGALIMDINTESRIFVNMPHQDQVSRRKLKTKRAAWLCVLGVCEVIGTALLIFMGCAGGVPSLTATPPSHIQASTVFGFTVFIVVVIFLHLSGGHVNPAVTVAAVIFKLISISTAAIYIIAQFIGAVLGYAALLMVFPEDTLYAINSNRNLTHGFCTTVPSPKVTTFQALTCEYLATAILIFVCCSIWDKRNSTNVSAAPLKVALTIIALAAALGPISGASLNPARTFGPAVFTGIWDRQWVYWLGPLAAAVTTTLFYKFIFERYQNPDQETP